MTDYKGIGEADKRIAQLEAELDVATRELVKQGQMVQDLSAELAEFKSWRTGEVPEGIERLEIQRMSNCFCAKMIGNLYYTPMGRYVNLSEAGYRWRPVREGE